jgi:phosphatidylinositol phospholipase C, beta
VEEPTETDPESRARSLAREHIAQEKDLQEKYHDAASFLVFPLNSLSNGNFQVFSTLEKAMKASQAAQLKTLATLVERETAEVMKKLESARRDEVKALAKIHKDKDEMVRIKREVASSIVEKGVSERVRLKEAYRKRQEELERQHSEARSRLEEERAKVKFISFLALFAE